MPELNCNTLVGIGMPTLNLPVEPASWCQKPGAPTKTGSEIQLAKPPLTEIHKVAAVLHVFSHERSIILKVMVILDMGF